ncbi:MAG: methyltransferase domain-containing protein [Candidatus Humimicrobiaceae bacterium]
MELKKSDYENYDYREFWEDNKRAYEDASERLALGKLFKTVRKSGVIIDIGCGYGRLFNEYKDFDKIIMMDYSLNNLKNTKDTVFDYLKQDNTEFDKVHFIAADALNLPFKNAIFNAAISVRIVHHLNNPEKFISETGRILKNKGLFILEFANKRNLKNIFKFIFGKLSQSPFSPEPYMIGENIQNNHPRVVIGYFKKNDLKINKIISVSNLRAGFLKRKLSLRNLLRLENISQGLFSLCKPGPSIFIKAFKNINENIDNMEKIPQKFTDMLLCPGCKNLESKLEISENFLICNFCGSKYAIAEGIFDLRLKN